MTLPESSAAAFEKDERASVRAVQRALSVLDCLSDGRSKMTLSEAARLTGLPISTVSRLLATLEGAGFLRRSAFGYACGTRLMQIGLNALKNISSYEVAEPHLLSLTEITGETCYLGIPGDDESVVYVRQSMSPKSIRHSVWLGRAVPLQGTAIGAAMRGNVNGDGYAATRQTLEPDVTAIAAPVRNAEGAIIAAINLTGPSYRISDADIIRFGRAVVGAAAAIAKDIGAGFVAR